MTGKVIKGNQDALVRWLASFPTKGAKQAVILSYTHPDMLVKSREVDTAGWLGGWLAANDRATGDLASIKYPAGVARLALRGVTLGACYGAAVNRQRAKDEMPGAGEFIPELLWNGKGIYHSPYTVQHSGKGTVYFNYKPMTIETDTEIGSMAFNWKDKWTDVSTGREIVGMELTDLCENWLKANPHKAERQGVEHDVQWRCLKLENVVEVRYGDIFQIDPNPMQYDDPAIAA